MSVYISDSPTASVETILQCLSATPSSTSLTCTPLTCTPLTCTPLTSLNDDDWDDIAVTAIALGLAPLLHWYLEQSQISLPPLALAKLGVTRQAHAKRNQAIAGQLAEVLAIFNRRHSDVLILKGALLAPMAYPDAALRPMNDIDLLFRPQDLSKIDPLLQSLGYSGKHKSADQGPGVTKHLSTYRRAGNEGATPNPYLSPGGDRMIEPHGSLEESWFGLKVDITPGVWERAVHIELHGQPAFRLSTADMIIHLAVHAAFHFIMGSSLFVQLYDLRQVLTVWPDEVNWSEIIDLSQAAQAEPFVYAALYWARKLLSASVPDGPLQQLQGRCPSRLVAYIQALDGAAIFQRTQQPPLATVAQRLRRGLADRHETARWAGTPAAKWRVWQTALAFYKTDTANLLQRRLKTEI